MRTENHRGSGYTKDALIELLCARLGVTEGEAEQSAAGLSSEEVAVWVDDLRRPCSCRSVVVDGEQKRFATHDEERELVCCCETIDKQPAPEPQPIEPVDFDRVIRAYQHLLSQCVEGGWRADVVIASMDCVMGRRTERDAAELCSVNQKRINRCKASMRIRMSQLVKDEGFIANDLE
jgi:hypothetical protein